MTTSRAVEGKVVGRIFDLESAAEAARSDATDDEITIVFGEHRLVISTDLPYTMFQKMQDNDLDGALHDLLGDQADELLSDPNLKMRHITTLLTEIVQDATGQAVGEASGSPTPLRSTTRK